MKYIYNDENLKFAIHKLPKTNGVIFEKRKEEIIDKKFGATLRT